MSDEETDHLSSREKLLKQHKAEVKELQGRILQLKKSVNKDKKRKKEVQDEIASLEKNLSDRHAIELAELEIEKSEDKEPDVVSAVNGVESLQIADKNNTNLDAIEDDEEAENINIKNKKVSKAQKRREKKTQASKDREVLIKEAEKMNKFSTRNIEAEKIKKILKELDLQMHEINPDGNCLYAAIAHQLGSDSSIADLRGKASCYIRDNMDDFLPFITDPKSGELLTPEQFEEYCHQLEHTSAWGGQPELRALSQTLKRRIEVIQADSSPIIFGEEFISEKAVLLAYYRHYYGLGEHYNSVEPWKPEETDSS